MDDEPRLSDRIAANHQFNDNPFGESLRVDFEHMGHPQRPPAVGSIWSSDAHVDIGADVDLGNVDFEDARPRHATFRETVNSSPETEAIDDHLWRGMPGPP